MLESKRCADEKERKVKDLIQKSKDFNEQLQRHILQYVTIPLKCWHLSFHRSYLEGKPQGKEFSRSLILSHVSLQTDISVPIEADVNAISCRNSCFSCRWQNEKRKDRWRTVSVGNRTAFGLQSATCGTNCCKFQTRIEGAEPKPGCYSWVRFFYRSKGFLRQLFMQVILCCLRSYIPEHGWYMFRQLCLEHYLSLNLFPREVFGRTSRHHSCIVGAWCYCLQFHFEVWSGDGCREVTGKRQNNMTNV